MIWQVILKYLEYIGNLKEKLIQEKDKLKQEKKDFEAYKETEERNLKVKLIQDRIDHDRELGNWKLHEMNKIRDEFSASIQNELDNLNQKEMKLKEWQQELDNAKKIFQKDKKCAELWRQLLLKISWAFYWKA